MPWVMSLEVLRQFRGMIPEVEAQASPTILLDELGSFYGSTRVAAGGGLKGTV